MEFTNLNGIPVGYETIGGIKIIYPIRLEPEFLQKLDDKGRIAVPKKLVDAYELSSEDIITILYLGMLDIKGDERTKVGIESFVSGDYVHQALHQIIGGMSDISEIDSENRFTVSADVRNWFTQKYTEELSKVMGRIYKIERKIQPPFSTPHS
ncbi:hypothetical protein HY638_02715 [Candidatus Woesearchaeota archaeon]|nr:hypothetical protein [Candidatus Woesearchaeota archaeon]